MFCRSNWKTTVCRSLFYNESAGFMDKVTLFTFKFYPAQVFSSEICENFNNTFDNTNNSVEHLRNRWRLFYGSKIHSSLIPFSEECMKVKKSIKSQPVRYMCHADTCVLHEIRNEWILQFSFQLTNTVGAKKKIAH